MPVLIDDHIAAAGDSTAIVDHAGALTWLQLGERVDRWIGLLTSRGLVPGDRVACVLGNRRETFELALACLHTGVTVVPINWHLTETEIAYLLTDSGSRALVVEDAYAAVAVRAAARTEGVCELVLNVDGAGEGGTAAGPLLEEAGPAVAPEPSCGAVMFYTSGTTAAPKGVVNGMFVAGAPFERVTRLVRYAHRVLDVPARERVLLDGPWYHSSQFFFSMFSLLQGSALVIRRHFDPAATLAVIDRERITAVHLVPTQFIRMLRLDAETRASFSGASLRRVWHGGGPCPIDVKQRMIEWWGPVLLEYYGATEGGAVTLIDSASWLDRPGSVGRAVPPVELVIVDETGSPLPPGREGRIFVRRRVGERFHYHNAPEKTRSAYLGQDTFTYGEVGYVDPDGYLYLTGRAQDLIVSGGVNIYPAEVEAVLLTHPAVDDVAVVGIPDDEFGEKVLAIVVPRPGAGLDLEAALTDHCRLSLAGFKTPRAYKFVADLAREATGKLRKDLLRARYEPAVAVNGTEGQR